MTASLPRCLSPARGASRTSSGASGSRAPILIGRSSELRRLPRTVRLASGCMPWLSVKTSAAWLTPRIRGSRRSVPTLLEVFDESTAPGLTQQPDVPQERGLRGSRLPRFNPTNPNGRAPRSPPLAGASRGGRYQLTARLVPRPRAGPLFVSTDDASIFSSTSPLLHGHRVLSLRALAVLSDASNGHVVPFYLSPTLGGLNIGRGFPTFRFRDRNLLALQAEYRYQVNPLDKRRDLRRCRPGCTACRCVWRFLDSRRRTGQACALEPEGLRPCAWTLRSAASARRSSWGWVMPSEQRVMAFVLVVGVITIADVRSATPRFYPDDPLRVDNDRAIDVTRLARSSSTITTTSSRTRSARRATARGCAP